LPRRRPVKDIASLFTGKPQPANTPRAPLPPALDPGALHTAMLQSPIPLPPRPGEDLNAQQQRLNDLRAKQRELDRLEARLRREAQFSRKVALSRQVRALRDAVARPGAG
jgi:hypothetical protein